MHLSFKSSRLEKGFVYSVILITLLTCYPFVFKQIIAFPSFLIITIVSLCVTYFYLFNKKKIRPLPNVLIATILVQLTAWSCYAVIHMDMAYFARVICLFLVLGWILALNGIERGVQDFIRLFNAIMLFMAIGGMLGFFLVLVFGYPPLYEGTNMDGRALYYFGTTFTNVYVGDRFIRYSGCFDEPGAMAQWGIFALLLNRLVVKDSKYEKWMIISLLFTFSLAYYILLAAYVVFFLLKKIKHIFILLICLLSLFFVIYSTKGTEYDYIYRMTFARFEYDESIGTIAGNSRVDISELALEQFRLSPVFGIGDTYMKSLEYMSDNPYEILARDGVVGWIVSYIPLFLMLIIGLKNKNILFATLILFAEYMQRPFHVQNIHYLMLYIICYVAVSPSIRPQSKKSILLYQ